ncbi:formyltransferase family protein [Solidesulfovibrio sp.]|uniref:formyltransferase family protein n=1 Tax=Solidesulfovibrio sp. TaxID=2910990 RepID=UPI002B219BC8|nr:formyltransferase family protein [Solidesulfovibrio sp.]MEA5088405.1 formyltransferase family protein [Solidesulfovibrio sp.]
MKITVFTGNQARHIALLSAMASIADEVYAVQECCTVFPGKVADFYRKSDIMQQYFSQVIASENRIFGDIRFSPSNVRTLSIKSDDLNCIEKSVLAPALSSDIYVVFGASFIKGYLIDFLVANRAVNIHMGVSPYYRGSSCNFWALFDGNPNLVGATIHLLSRGLDSGDMLFHAFPKPQACDPFLLGMKAVKSAIASLAKEIAAGTLFNHVPVTQNKMSEIRYTKNSDFTDEVARLYLSRKIDADKIGELFDSAPGRELISPIYMD